MSRRIRTYPRCPYCRYDLTGQVRSWTASCPLRALCSECGREYDTAEAMRRMDYGPHWLFEHAPRPGLWAFIDTSGLAFNPRMLWRVIGPALPMRGGRLAVFGAIWAVLSAIGGLLLGWVLLGGFYAEALGNFWIEETTGHPAETVGLALLIAQLAAPVAPLLFMPLVAARLVHRRAGPGHEGRILRGLACTLPIAAVWLLAMFLGWMQSLVFLWMSAAGFAVAGALLLFAMVLPSVFLVWWWRTYLRLHFGIVLSRRETVFVAIAALALVLVLTGGAMLAIG